VNKLKKKRVKNPVTALSVGLEENLHKLGYAADTIWKQRRLLNDLLSWLAGQQMELSDLSEVQVNRFMGDRRAAGVRKLKTPKALSHILHHLRGLGLVRNPEALKELGPAGPILDQYRRFLRSERGLSGTTVHRYVDCLRPFLDARIQEGGLELASLTSADVTSFVVAWCPSRNTGVAKLTLTALRSFLGFLHLDGVTERPLAPAVPSVLHRRLAGLPKGLERDQVRRLLAACDISSIDGVRDLAILTLLLRLGLRRSEVARLGLDDIDWRAGTVCVHGKGNRHERLPLPADVGQSVAQYLRHARPAKAEGRMVFVRHIAPHRALSPSRVSTIVAEAARRAGLGRVHAHRLRHTAATELLRAGASLSEIGQLLRHRRAQTTAIYAKVDRNNLRLIARPWPEDAQ
jgi:site-specific recombinase XerD